MAGKGRRCGQVAFRCDQCGRQSFNLKGQGHTTCKKCRNARPIAPDYKVEIIRDQSVIDPNTGKPIDRRAEWERRWNLPPGALDTPPASVLYKRPTFDLER